jgi:hypothetical protein
MSNGMGRLFDFVGREALTVAARGGDQVKAAGQLSYAESDERAGSAGMDRMLGWCNGHELSTKWARDLGSGCARGILVLGTG